MGIVNNVKTQRLKKDINQTQMATLCGVSRQTIHSIEAGKYTPSVELALIISQVLKKKVESLFILENQNEK